MSISSRTWNKQFRQLVNWDKYQLAIFDWVENGEGNALISGVAGCGKSTTIVGSLACIKGKSQLVAFNTHIANHLRIDSRITKSRVCISTTHSLGLSILKRLMNNEVQVDNNKLRDLLRATFQQRGLTGTIVKREIGNIFRDAKESAIEKQYYKLRKGLIDIARKMQANLSPADITNVLETCIQYNIYLPVSMEFFYNYLIDIPLILLEEGEKLATNEGIIDYGDMIWLPNKWDIKDVPQKDFFIADEVQDANKAMIYLYKRYIDKGARGLFFGDPNQAIFGFAGSDLKSWDLLEEEFNPIILPLSYCYRCASSHIAVANHIVPNIEAAPGAIKGNIQIKSLANLIDMVGTDDLIICRITHPLVSTCIRLLGKGKLAYIKGIEIRDSLISLVDELNVDNEEIIHGFGHRLNEYRKTILDEETKGNSAKDYLAIDRIRAIEYCLEEYFNEQGLVGSIVNVKDFKNYLRHLFEPRKGAIVLSTIHRAKGDEANNVWILNSDNLPFLYKARQEWEKQQEWNLVYVALTRAKKNLYLVPERKSSPLQPGILETILDYQPPKPMDIPIDFFTNEWAPIIRNTVPTNKWSYKPSDEGYRPDSNKAFVIYDSKNPKKYLYSTLNEPINWLTPSFNITTMLHIIASQGQILGIEDYVLLVPDELDTLLVKVNELYRDNSPMDILVINLSDTLFNNHVILVNKDVAITSVWQSPIVIKVCPSVNIYQLMGD